MKVLVTGGAGFIGASLVDRLVQEHEVTVIDNLSSGKIELINKKARFVKSDLFTDEIVDLFSGQDCVFHLAANPNVKLGAEDTRVHLEQNIIVTHRVLEAIRKQHIKKVVFTSTSTVYGEAPMPTPETYGPLLPTSLYGASKEASEALISSYCYTFDIDSWIYRFANVVGPRSTHGVILDFINKLKTNPEQLEILGDGNQTKSYIYIDDCIDAMTYGLDGRDKINVFNIGSKDQLSVKEIAAIVSEEMGLKPQMIFGTERRGWKGDVPDMRLSIEKLTGLGWSPKYSSYEAIRKTVRSLNMNRHHNER